MSATKIWSRDLSAVNLQSNNFITNSFTSNSIITNDLSATKIWSRDLSSINLQANTAIISPGNLGIGLTNPDAPLHLAGYIKVGTNTDPPVPDNNNTYLFNQLNVGPTIRGFRFEVQTNGSNQRLRIDENGNVGIGTTSPAYKFDVSGETRIQSNNIRYGIQAGQTNQGSFGIAVGFQAGQFNQQMNSIAIGYNAGISNEAFNSISIGTDAGKYSQGENSVSIGKSSGFTKQGFHAVAIGNEAGITLQGFHSVAIGDRASSANYAVSVGQFAGNSNQGAYSIAIGTESGQNRQNTEAIAIGRRAAQNDQSGNCIAIGNGAGRNNQYLYSIAIGSSAGSVNQKANSVAIGDGAAENNQGTFSVSVGGSAGRNNQRSMAVAIGYNSGNTTQGIGTVAIGTEAGYTTQQDYAVAIGYKAGFGTQGSGAISIGYQAGFTGQGIQSVAIGDAAGYTRQGNYSVAIGLRAGGTNQNIYSVAIGYQAGGSNQSSGAVAIGINAGQTIQGLNTVAIGNSAGLASQGNNATAIGNGAGSNSQGNEAIAIGTGAGSGSQGAFSIGIGTNCGAVSQSAGAIAIGNQTGKNTQSQYGIAIGYNNAEFRQGTQAIAIGTFAGRYDQSANSIALGTSAGFTGQRSGAIALGFNAGISNEGINAIAIGTESGKYSQSSNAIAIGVQAGFTGQGVESIAIGNLAGRINQTANSIIINATGQDLSAIDISGLYIAPIREGREIFMLTYNTNNKEIRYTQDISLNNLQIFNRSIISDLSATKIWSRDLSAVNLQSTTAIINDLSGTKIWTKDLSSTNFNTNNFTTDSFTANIIITSDLSATKIRTIDLSSTNIDISGSLNTNLITIPLLSGNISLSFNNIVYDIKYSNYYNSFFVCGDFTTITDNDNNIYNTTRIAAINTINGRVSNLLNGIGPNEPRIMAIDDISGILYVGGLFVSVNGNSTIRYLTRWDGSTWSSIGTTLADAVTSNPSCVALYFNPNTKILYAGGRFTSIGGVNTNSVAQYNSITNTWSNLGTVSAGADVRCEGLDFSANKLYVCGSFTTIYNTSVNKVAVYDTITPGWSGIGSGIGTTLGEFPKSIKYISNTAIYIGGTFQTVNSGGSTNASFVAVWNGSTWANVGGYRGFNNPCNIINPDNLGNIYFGGDFTSINLTTTPTISAPFIAKFNGTNWIPTNGLPGSCQSIYINNNNIVYAGGQNYVRYYYDTLNPISINHIEQINDVIIENTNYDLRSELLLFKGNLDSTTGELDRIRLRSSSIAFDTFTNGTTITNRKIENIRMYIDNNGNIGVGTTQPQYTFDLSGEARISSNNIRYGLNAGNNNQGTNAIALGVQAGFTGQGSGTVAIGFNAGISNEGINSIAIGTDAGKYAQGSSAIAIGNSSALSGQSNRAIAIGNQAGNIRQGTNAIAIGFQAGLNNQRAHSIVIDACGNGTGGFPTINGDISGACYIRPIREAPTYASYRTLMYNDLSNELVYSRSTTTQSKTFVIDHPIYYDRHLVHSCLEGPEVGIYYRGSAIFNDNIDELAIPLPNYVKSFAYGYTVSLTPKSYNGPNIFHLSATDVIDGKFTVYRLPLLGKETLEQKCRFDWMVMAKRGDINVEPYKKDVIVKGDGPYKYI